MTKKALIICGPTAVGKTSLGIMLAKDLGGEILSADSRQVYTGLDVLTGKDVGDSRFRICEFGFKDKGFTFGYYLVNGVKIWGLDIVGPEYLFNVSDYLRYAGVILPYIWDRNKLPVIVGGTGLYIKALLEPPETVNLKPDWELRQRLERLSVASLQKRLQKVNKEKFDLMNYSDKSNPRRLIRAIEVSRFGLEPRHEALLEGCDILFVGLRVAREVLYRRIDKRLEQLIKGGAEEEIRRLLKRGVSQSSPALSATGAKPFLAKLGDGGKSLTDVDRKEVLQRWQFADHGLARQQITWFRHQLPVEWFDIDNRGYPGTVHKWVNDWYNKR